MENLLAVLCILALLPVCLTADAPNVNLMNAAKPGTKMPVTGIGTGFYNHQPGSDRPGEVWNDTIAEKAIMEWIALGGRHIDGCVDYRDQIHMYNYELFQCIKCTIRMYYLNLCWLVITDFNPKLMIDRICWHHQL